MIAATAACGKAEADEAKRDAEHAYTEIGTQMKNIGQEISAPLNAAKLA